MKDYKKILEGIVNIISNTEKGDTVSNICSYINENCPELTESKDERIRKWLIEYFSRFGRYAADSIEEFGNGLKIKDILDWLEKQNNNKPKPDFRERYKKMTESEWFKKTYGDKSCGIESVSVDEADETITIPDGYVATIEDNKVHIKREGKSALEAINEKPVDNANKAEPKFHKGEWIIFNGSILLVNEVVQGYYRTISRDGIYNSYDWSIDYAARPWTIEEAKDGDVLTSYDYEYYVIFKEIDGLDIRCYCTFRLNMGSIPTFCVNTLQNKAAFCPVTDKERGFFLEKVNEFGYGWDCENKKLFKI